MTTTSAALLALAVASGFAGMYFLVLGWVRPRLAPHRSLGRFGVALALWHGFGAVAHGAHTPEEAAPFQTLAALGGILAICQFTEHAFVVSERGARWLAVSRVTTLIACIGALSRLFYDPAHALGMVGPPALAAPTLGGYIVSAPAWAMAVVGFAQMYAAARRDRVLAVPSLLGTASLVTLAAEAYFFAGDPKDHFPLGSVLVTLALIGFAYLAVGRVTQLDEELERQGEALARAHAELSSAQREIVRNEQLAAVGELSAVIAHEVRNPLAIIKNAVSGLGRPSLDAEDEQTLLAILDEEADRLDRLVDDLLAYARPISVDREPVDLRALVARAVELAAGGNPASSRVEVELGLDSPVEPVLADEALLRHALINIVDNALQAMPHGGTLSVVVREATFDERPAVAVELRDTGEGMDTLVRTRARDPFFTTRARGTGLGLAIVERVASAHGGRVELESRHGKGTTVTLLLPRASSTPGS
ncbi:MAG: nitrogen regulation protein NR(II) [Sandaracinaceae bacterium]